MAVDREYYILRSLNIVFYILYQLAHLARCSVAYSIRQVDRGCTVSYSYLNYSFEEFRLAPGGIFS